MESGLRAAIASSASLSASSSVSGGDVHVGGLEAPLDAVRVDLDAERDAAGHGDGERLRAAHAAEAGRQDEPAGQVGAVVLLPGGGERLVGALQDALGADVDPRAGGHLPVHGEPERVQPAELVPVGPVADQVGVGDEHARRHLVGLEHADRLAALHQQRLVVLEAAQRADDGVEAVPVAGGLAGAAVHDELDPGLGDLRIEVVHQHAQRGLLLPAPAADLGAARRAHRPRSRRGLCVHDAASLRGWVVRARGRPRFLAPPCARAGPLQAERAVCPEDWTRFHSRIRERAAMLESAGRRRRRPSCVEYAQREPCRPDHEADIDLARRLPT